MGVSLTLHPDVLQFTYGAGTFYQGVHLDGKAIAPNIQPPQDYDRYYDSRSVDIETGFSAFYPSIRNIGGVVCGLGYMQTLNLAAVANASGIIFINFDPCIALTLPLLLSCMRDADTPTAWLALVKKIFSCRVSHEVILENIPPAYHPAFKLHREHIRDYYNYKLNKPISNAFEDPTSFLGTLPTYRHIQKLVQAGAVAVIFEDFFGSETPNILRAALATMDGRLSTLYISNADCWLPQDKKNEFYRQAPVNFSSDPSTPPLILSSSLKDSRWSFHTHSP